MATESSDMFPVFQEPEPEPKPENSEALRRGKLEVVHTRESGSGSGSPTTLPSINTHGPCWREMFNKTKHFTIKDFIK